MGDIVVKSGLNGGKDLGCAGGKARKSLLTRFHVRTVGGRAILFSGLTKNALWLILLTGCMPRMSGVPGVRDSFQAKHSDRAL